MIPALRYAARLVAFALRVNSWLYVAVILSLVSVMIEMIVTFLCDHHYFYQN